MTVSSAATLSGWAALVLTPLNHVLAQEGWAAARLLPHVGKVAVVRFPGLALRVEIGDDGRLKPAPADAPADVEIELPAEALSRVAHGPQALFGAANIRGKADFAEAFGFVLRHARWDAEEDLSRVVGDIAARRLMSAVRVLGTWGGDAAKRLADNASEFARHELRLVALPEEVEAFSGKVDDLAGASERLEIRLRQLERRIGDT